MNLLRFVARTSVAMGWLVVAFLPLAFVPFGSCEKLNERRILLPYNSGLPSNFTLEVLHATACCKVVFFSA